MNRQEIESRVKRVIRDLLDTPEDRIHLESTITQGLDGGLCADSLSVVEILMGLEGEFEVEIPDEEAAKFNTVADIINYMESHT